MLPTNYRNKIYDKAHSRLGTERQVDQAIEELGELIIALMHYRRGRGSIADISTEIADVRIMLEQLERIYDCGKIIDEQMDYKITRLRKRIMA